jgi:hypothetical protein
MAVNKMDSTEPPHYTLKFQAMDSTVPPSYPTDRPLRPPLQDVYRIGDTGTSKAGQVNRLPGYMHLPIKVKSVQMHHKARPKDLPWRPHPTLVPLHLFYHPEQLRDAILLLPLPDPANHRAVQERSSLDL